MTCLFVVLFGMYTRLMKSIHLNELRREQEKALHIGHDAGVNWALDMSVDEYVVRQQIRRDTKLSQ